ncbi:hypothetical protein GOP47_0012914, partial [Adiantum capillus-veneris]
GRTLFAFLDLEREEACKIESWPSSFSWRNLPLRWALFRALLLNLECSVIVEIRYRHSQSMLSPGFLLDFWFKFQNFPSSLAEISRKKCNCTFARQESFCSPCVCGFSCVLQTGF